MLSPSSSLQELSEWIREKRYLTENCHTASSSSELGIVINDCLTEEQETALASANEVPPLGSIVFKYGHRSFVGSSPIAGTHLALKYYHRLSLRRQLGYTMRGSRCMRAWIASRAFYQLGICTPKPIAIFEKRRFRFLTDSALFVTEVADGLPLPEYLKKHSHNEEKMCSIADQCAALFAKFKKYRIIHRDTAPKNFIVLDSGEVSIIDLDAVELALPLKSWQKKHKKDLYRFSIVWRVHFPHLAPIFSERF